MDWIGRVVRTLKFDGDPHTLFSKHALVCKSENLPELDRGRGRSEWFVANRLQDGWNPTSIASGSQAGWQSIGLQMTEIRWGGCDCDCESLRFFGDLVTGCKAENEMMMLVV